MDVELSLVSRDQIVQNARHFTAESPCQYHDFFCNRKNFTQQVFLYAANSKLPISPFSSGGLATMLELSASLCNESQVGFLPGKDSNASQRAPVLGSCIWPDHGTEAIQVSATFSSPNILQEIYFHVWVLLRDGTAESMIIESSEFIAEEQEAQHQLLSFVDDILCPTETLSSEQCAPGDVDVVRSFEELGVSITRVPRQGWFAWQLVQGERIWQEHLSALILCSGRTERLQIRLIDFPGTCDTHAVAAVQEAVLYFCVRGPLPENGHGDVIDAGFSDASWWCSDGVILHPDPPILPKLTAGSLYSAFWSDSHYLPLHFEAQSQLSDINCTIDIESLHGVFITHQALGALAPLVVLHGLELTFGEAYRCKLYCHNQAGHSAIATSLPFALVPRDALKYQIEFEECGCGQRMCTSTSEVTAAVRIDTNVKDELRYLGQQIHPSVFIEKAAFGIGSAPGLDDIQSNHVTLLDRGPGHQYLHALRLPDSYGNDTNHWMQGMQLYFTVTVQDSIGRSASRSCGPVTLDMTPPIPPWKLILEHPITETLVDRPQGQSTYDMSQCIDSLENVTVSWDAFTDPEAFFIKHTVRLLSSNGLEVLVEFDAGTARTLSFPSSTIWPSLSTVVIEVEGCNEAGLCSSLSSSPITLDPNPIDDGIVLDGFGEVDVDYFLESSAHISARWVKFSDLSCGVCGSEWCLGYAQGSCDVMPREILHPGASRAAVSASTINAMLGVVGNRRIFATVFLRKCHSMNWASMSSDGFTIVHDATTTAHLSLSRGPDLLALAWSSECSESRRPSQVASASRSSVLLDFEVSSSQIPLSFARITVRSNSSSHQALPWTYIDTLAPRPLTIPGLDLWDGEEYIAEIEVCDAAQRCVSVVSSSALLVDSTPPVVDPRILQVVKRDEFAFEITVDRIFDAESTIDFLQVTVGSQIPGQDDVGRASLSAHSIPFLTKIVVSLDEHAMSSAQTTEAGLILHIGIWVRNLAGLWSNPGFAEVLWSASTESLESLTLMEHECVGITCDCAVTCHDNHVHPCPAWLLERMSPCLQSDESSEIDIGEISSNLRLGGCDLDVEESSRDSVDMSSARMGDFVSGVSDLLAYHLDSAVNQTGILRIDYSAALTGGEPGSGIAHPILQNPWRIGFAKQSSFGVTVPMSRVVGLSSQVELSHLAGDTASTHLAEGSSFEAILRVWVSASKFLTIRSTPMTVSSQRPSIHIGGTLRDEHYAPSNRSHGFSRASPDAQHIAVTREDELLGTVLVRARFDNIFLNQERMKQCRVVWSSNGHIVAVAKADLSQNLAIGALNLSLVANLSLRIDPIESILICEQWGWGAQPAIVASNAFILDGSPPSATPFVSIGNQFHVERRTKTDRVSASWLPAYDRESGVLRYVACLHSIDEKPEHSCVSSKTRALLHVYGEVECIFKEDIIDLPVGHRFRVSVQAENGAGLVGPWTSSDAFVASNGPQFVDFVDLNQDWISSAPNSTQRERDKEFIVFPRTLPLPGTKATLAQALSISECLKLAELPAQNLSRSPVAGIEAWSQIDGVVKTGWLLNSQRSPSPVLQLDCGSKIERVVETQAPVSSILEVELRFACAGLDGSWATNALSDLPVGRLKIRQLSQSCKSENSCELLWVHLYCGRTSIHWSSAIIALPETFIEQSSAIFLVQIDHFPTAVADVSLALSSLRVHSVAKQESVGNMIHERVSKAKVRAPTAVSGHGSWCLSWLLVNKEDVQVQVALGYAPGATNVQAYKKANLPGTMCVLPFLSHGSSVFATIRACDRFGRCASAFSSPILVDRGSFFLLPKALLVKTWRDNQLDQDADVVDEGAFYRGVMTLAIVPGAQVIAEWTVQNLPLSGIRSCCTCLVDKSDSCLTSCEASIALDVHLNGTHWRGIVFAPNEFIEHGSLSSPSTLREF
eukprot:m.203971 g.203971  ORF g.203971 m.203971 type:complete len:1910 (+) comp10695_c2_seq1:5642-11371(+)